MIGLPMLIIDFMICDLILPNSSFYNKILYALSLISWETILHNMLVYFELIDGINMTLALPIIYLFNLSTLILLPHLWKYVNTQFSPNAEA
jgi:hypothetical protein